MSSTLTVVTETVAETVKQLHPNLKLMSHSSDQILNACPRLYELDRLSTRSEDDRDIHTDFGKVLGVGVQDYLVHRNSNHAVMQMFSFWEGDLDETADDKEADRKKKTFWHALYALDKFVGFQVQALNCYEVVRFDGRPAIELGFRIDCGGGFVYRGKLDALLQSRTSGAFGVFDCKSTGSNKAHDAMFKHSGQGLGYSLVVDAIAANLKYDAASNYEIIYGLYKAPIYEWERFSFTKSHTQRALWIRQLLISIKHIIEYGEEGFFPMRGESCYRFFRPCKFYDICEFSNSVLVGPEPKEKIDKEEDYTFHFNLDEIIEAQIRKQMT